MSKYASTRGFTLLEVVLATTVTVIATSAVTIAFRHTMTVVNLEGTATRLVYQLRYLQEVARTEGIYGQIRMSLYTPEYQTYQGTTRLGMYSFSPGVHYADGYLQMPTGDFLYNVLGDGQMAGRVRLVSGDDEQDVALYMGSGWQALEGIQREHP